MAEAEDLLADAARHATIFTRDLWRRHRKRAPGPALPQLVDVGERVDLLLLAAFGVALPLRVAQVPAPPTFLVKVFRRSDAPRRRFAVPATDDRSIWLPASLSDYPLGCANGVASPEPTGEGAADQIAQLYRTLALQQAMRAHRGSARALYGGAWPDAMNDALLRDLYRLVEAVAADVALCALLPGMRGRLASWRAVALAARPELERLPARLQPLERLVRQAMASDCVAPPADWPRLETPADSMRHARALLAVANPQRESPNRFGVHPLFVDAWIGELRPPGTIPTALAARSGASESDADDGTNPRSARLPRSPEQREALPDEDEDRGPGVWMVQTEKPHEQAEDPMGLARPVDRDVATAADDYADALSELEQARLVTAPGTPKEVLLSDDAPSQRSRLPQAALSAKGEETAAFDYPEWDWSTAGYRHPGATVRLMRPQEGPMAWVEATMAEHRVLLDAIARRFEVLRARPERQRRRLDGDEIDLEAWLESHADFRAGRARNAAIYSQMRRARRDLAVELLIDVSGSTDGWISTSRRVIDVEREALLLVCVALERMGQPYAVQAFSGEGPGNVTVRPLKDFDERWSMTGARRIAALEPERYTRAGAALRHASAHLMRQAAQHRLLLLLSDGKPNDQDEYEGRYGVEDMRQAVTEARLQGISPFCLTIDRQGASYLPAVFGAGHYALLPKPELLPTVLLEWVKRLVVR